MVAIRHEPPKKKKRLSNVRRAKARAKLLEKTLSRTELHDHGAGTSLPTPGQRNTNAGQAIVTGIRQAPAARPSPEQPALVGSSAANDSAAGAGDGDRAADAPPLARLYEPPPIRFCSKGNHSANTCVEDLHMAMAQRYNMALTCTRADVDAFVVNKLGLKLGTGITGPEEDLLKNFLWKHGYRYDHTVFKEKLKVEQTRGCDKANDVRRFCIDKGLGMYHVTSAQDPGFIQHVIAVHVQRDKCEYFEDGAWHPLDKLTYVPQTFIRYVRRFEPGCVDLTTSDDDDNVQKPAHIDLTTSDNSEVECSDDADEYSVDDE